MGEITKIADDFIDALDNFGKAVHESGAAKDPAFILATMAWAEFEMFAFYRLKTILYLLSDLFTNKYLSISDKVMKTLWCSTYPFTITFNYLTMPFRLMKKGRQLKQSWWWCVKETSRLIVLEPICLLDNKWTRNTPNV